MRLSAQNHQRLNTSWGSVISCQGSATLLPAICESCHLLLHLNHRNNLSQLAPLHLKSILPNDEDQQIHHTHAKAIAGELGSLWNAGHPSLTHVEQTKLVVGKAGAVIRSVGTFWEMEPLGHGLWCFYQTISFRRENLKKKIYWSFTFMSCNNKVLFALNFGYEEAIGLLPTMVRMLRNIS